MSESLTFNMDCLDYMRSVPDKYFDLAVVDVPYGDASSQNGNVERERTWKRSDGQRFGGRFDKYRPSQIESPEQEVHGQASTGKKS